jgi:hypothetical protein
MLRVRTPAVRLVKCVGVALLGAACVSSGGVAARATAPLAVDREPAAAAVFVSAHGRADADGASRVLSDLFRVEALRRQRDPALSLDPLWSEVTRLADFAYLGTLTDDAGVAHVLYTAQPKRRDADGPTTIWRLDLDAAGRVIWGEPVRLLQGRRFERVASTNRTPGAVLDGPHLPAWSHGEAPEAVLGVRTSADEGYFALRFGSPGPVLFVIACGDGCAVPGEWSYGQELAATDADGQHVVIPPAPPSAVSTRPNPSTGTTDAVDRRVELQGPVRSRRVAGADGGASAERTRRGSPTSTSRSAAPGDRLEGPTVFPGHRLGIEGP